MKGSPEEQDFRSGKCQNNRVMIKDSDLSTNLNSCSWLDVTIDCERLKGKGMFIRFHNENGCVRLGFSKDPKGPLMSEEEIMERESDIQYCYPKVPGIIGKENKGKLLSIDEIKLLIESEVVEYFMNRGRLSNGDIAGKGKRLLVIFMIPKGEVASVELSMEYCDDRMFHELKYSASPNGRMP